MRARIVLLGTNHHLQFGGADCASEKIETFREYLRKTCRLYGIKCIAEEATTESLEKFGVSETVASVVARDERIEHCMVDLTIAERISLGIADGQLAGAAFRHATGFNCGPLRERLNKISNQVREGTWVGRTLAKGISPVLIVMGADHVRNVEKVLRSLRQELVIAHPDYEP